MEDVRVEKLWKLRSGVPVLRDISFTIRPGEVVALLGPSGSGKSTILRCINCLETLDGGKIFVRGVLIGYREIDNILYELKEKEICAQRSRIGMVFQSFNLFRHMTVLQNVMLGPTKILHQRRDLAEESALRLLEKVGLGDKAGALPSQLSGGQQQRVAIARAIVMEPMVLLLDEPTSALDPVLANEVVATIRTLAAEGRTMLIATHDMKVAREVANRVIFLESGKIEADVPCEEFFNAPQQAAAMKFLHWEHKNST